MQEYVINNRENSDYGTDKEVVNAVWAEAELGNDIWYRFVSGSRTGTIAKVVDPKNTFQGGWRKHLPRGSFEVDLGEGKIIKVGTKSYHNNFHFIVHYTGGHVNSFQKGLAPKSKPTKTGTPDMLGNIIEVGDWVIWTPHGNRSSKPSLGRLNRLSAAGSAWVKAPNRHGDEIEHRTDGAHSLIKVNMTPELHTTYQLCESLQGLRTKLIIDLDVEAY